MDNQSTVTGTGCYTTKLQTSPDRNGKYIRAQNSLLRRTLKERGLYSRQLDAFRTACSNLFSFLDQWNADIDKKQFSAGSMRGAPASSRRISVSKRSQHPLMQRELSLEEELQARLERHSRLAAYFRYLCREQKQKRFQMQVAMTECRSKCVELVQTMISYFNREVGALQQERLELDNVVEELQQENCVLQNALDDAVCRAAQLVEGLEQSLTNQTSKAKRLTSQMQALEAVCRNLKTKNDSLAQQVSGLQCQVRDLEQQAAQRKNALQSAEKAKDNFETLLEMALGKLRIFEESDLVCVQKYELFSASLDQTFCSQRTTLRRGIEIPCLSASTDNLSVHSHDGLSVASLPVVELSSQAQMRNASSPVSSSSSPIHCLPQSAPGRGQEICLHHTRKHENSRSLDSQLPVKSLIRDLRVGKAVCYGAEASTVCDLIHGTITPSSTSVANISTPRGRQERSAVVFSAISDHSAELQGCSVLKSTGSVTKLKRTTSSVSLRPTANGFIALAKDIEKKLKRKPRRKTTSVTDLYQAVGASGPQVGVRKHSDVYNATA